MRRQLARSQTCPTYFGFVFTGYTLGFIAPCKIFSIVIMMITYFVFQYSIQQNTGNVINLYMHQRSQNATCVTKDDRFLWAFCDLFVTFYQITLYSSPTYETEMYVNVNTCIVLYISSKTQVITNIPGKTKKQLVGHICEM